MTDYSATASLPHRGIGWRASVLPQRGSVAIQAETTIQRHVRVIDSQRRILFDRFGKGVEQRIPCRFRKLRMLGFFELLEHRQNIAAD